MGFGVYGWEQKIFNKKQINAVISRILARISGNSKSLENMERERMPISGQIW